MYLCTCCKTTMMVTKGEYIRHINSTKHKKKAFHLSAPFAGIDHEEFRPCNLVKTIPFSSIDNEFPSLCSDSGEVIDTQTITYEGIRDKYRKSDLIEPSEMTNGNVSNDDVDDDSSTTTTKTVEDVFFKTDCRIVAARHVIDRFCKGNKTASAALHEISVAMYWTLGFEQVPASIKKYRYMVNIDECDLISGEGDNKKEAKQEASSEAIKYIRDKLKKGKEHVSNGTSDRINEHSYLKENDWPPDAYYKLAIDKLIQIENLQENNFVVPRRYAVFIMTDTEDQLARDGVVVAFGAGIGVLKRTDIIKDYPGYHVTNFDSLVLAKRSLRCFFFHQMTLLFDENLPKSHSEKIYFTVGRNGKVRLRDGCRIHLFMSHAPFGDCVESLPCNWADPKEISVQELDRDRTGKVHPIMYMTYACSQYVKQPGHIRILKDDQSGHWVSLIEYRAKKKVAPDYMVMSPTDKLTSWVHVGLQGALLSHLMDPIRLYSIQVANDYIHEHFSRALLSRVPLENLIDEAGMTGFKDPYLGRVSKLPETVYPLYCLERKSVSYNWYSNPVTDLPEIIDDETGLVHSESPFKLPNGDPDFLCSRLSKVCMLLRLKKLFKLSAQYFAKRPELHRTRALQGIGQAAGYRYDLFKNSAIDYRSLKRCFFQHLRERNYGDWAPNNSSNIFDLLQSYEISENFVE